MTGKHDNQTNWVGGCSALSVVLALVFVQGCFPPPPPPPPVQPDMKAIVTVVAEAYGQLEQAASVFLGADAVEDTTMARVRTSLSNDLSSTFRPPSARISGDPGASIALGRFNLGDDGRLSVVASFVQEDGTGRGCTQYTLDREGDDWLVVGATDAWPDCPISTQGAESYHAVLARARSVECLGLWSNIGTCGDWLYAGEGLGHVGTVHYFDRSTGLAVASEQCTDVAEVADTRSLCQFVLGVSECEPEITETILCDR